VVLQTAFKIFEKVERMQLARLGDLCAIPFFLWLCIYFYRKPVLTEEEKILYIFAATGLVADLMFVFIL
jgi:hypothetical protein